MHDGVFLTLSIAFASADERATALSTPLLSHRAALEKAGAALEDSEIMGSGFTVPATSLKEALKTLADQGIELSKRDVVTWEKVAGAGGPEISIVTRGELAGDATAKDLLAWVKKRAKAGETFFRVTDSKKSTQILGYLDGYDDYCGVQEAMFLAVAAAAAAGARASAGFFADRGLLDPAVYCGVACERGGAVASTRFDEPQDMTEADVSGFVRTFGMDFDAISAARGAWLEVHATKKMRTMCAGNAGFVRPDGTFAIEPKYPSLGMFHEGRAVFMAAGSWGYLDEGGQEVVPAQFMQAADFKEGRARVRQKVSSERTGPHTQRVSYRFGFIDRNGGWLIEPTFEQIEDFSCGRAMFVDGNKHGYVDEGGAACIPAQFDHATSFSEGRGLVCVGDRYAGGKWGFIDPAGQWLIPARFRSAGAYKEGFAPFQSEGDRWGLLDAQGKIALAPRFREAAFVSGGLVIGLEDKGWGAFTPSGDVVVPGEYLRVADHGEVLEAMFADTTRALFDRRGRRLDELRVADNAACTEGLVAVQSEKGGKWGYVDTMGQLVIAPTFRRAFPFGQGRAIVVDDEGVAIIGRDGSVTARCAMDGAVRDATGFGKSGLASIDFYKLALVATDGRVVIPFHLSGVYGLDEPQVWVKFAALD
jgi:hypothetical protein